MYFYKISIDLGNFFFLIFDMLVEFAFYIIELKFLIVNFTKLKEREEGGTN